MLRLGGLAKAVIAGVVVLMSLSAWGGLQTHRYFTRDTDSCVSCHNESSAHLRASSHLSLECASCHEVKFTETFGQYLTAKVKGPKAYVEHARPELGRCAECHLGGAVGVQPIAATQGHKVHVLGKPHLECRECHGGTTHVESPDPEACGRCHKDVVVRDEAMAGVSCLSCHNFLARSTPERTGAATDCQRCHGGSKADDRSPRFAATVKASIIDADSIHGAVNACRLCHNPHAADPTERVTGRDCSRCHARISQELVAADDPGHPDCGMCHEVHGPRPNLADICTDCHSNRSVEAEPRALSSKHQACQQCHSAHRFAPERERCSECHQKEQQLVTTWGKDPAKDAKRTAHKDCFDCHQGHGQKPAAAACAGCHPAAAGHGHASCTTCHQPHRDKSATQACATCHQGEEKVVRAAGRPEAHRQCSSCHAQHAPASTAVRCRSCHEPESTLVRTASVAAHQRCSSCHDAHEFRRSLGACAACHQPASLGVHRQTCSQCHQVHGPPGGDQVDCQSCHAQIKTAAGKHSQCRSCHSPHQSKQGEPACTACHASQKNGTLAWKASEHQACASCHPTHQPLEVKTCAACHASEAQGVSQSKHRCGSCHDPHRAPLKWWSTCSGCHQDKTAVTSRLGPTHSQCRSCHEPHAVKKPACQTCHTERPGAHATKGHQQCTSCHQTHALGTPTRGQCLGCHRDMTDHFPNAQLCSACHPFK